jgi:hypothetical protein
MTQELAIVNKSSLRPGQLSLYKLIVNKIDTGDILTLDEARHIWLTKVHGDVEGDKVYCMDYYVNRRRPMSNDEINFNVMNWLMLNIGRLVIRGYLKVVPQIELKQLEG